MKFPITALDLAKLAQERLERQSEAVQKEMVGEILPRTVAVILARQEDCKRISKAWDSETAKRMVESIAQLLWSNPGSMGGLQIERLLIANEVNREDADTFATNLIKYSRYSMSVVNSLRHYKTAIMVVRDIIDPVEFRERYLGSPALPEKLLATWPSRSDEFGQELFEEASKIPVWLAKLENFIAEVTTASNWAKRRPLHEQDPNGWEKISSVNISMAKAYTRRYGRFLTQEYKNLEFGGRYVPSSRSRIKSINEELEELREKLAEDDKLVFKLFENDYEVRSHRITSLGNLSSRPAFKRNTSDFSYFENFISNQVKLGGRDLMVRSRSEQVSSELINQMYKLFIAQLELDPTLERFSNRAEREGQTLVVELDKPQLSDAAKIKKILNVLFNK